MDKAKDLLCPFYEKTGVCFHGDMCSRTHRRPALCRCLLFHRLYPDPDLFAALLPPGALPLSAAARQALLDSFFLDVVLMLRQFGALEDVLVSGSASDLHAGNTYAMFRDADAAEAAYAALNRQYYAGRRVEITFAPLARLSHAVCRDFAEGGCALGAQCGFVHPLEPSEYVARLCFPRGQRAYPGAFRRTAQRIADAPADVLYGRARSRYEERAKAKE